jgi:hypothetical protein
MWLGLSSDVTLGLLYATIVGWILFVPVQLRRRISRWGSVAAGTWALRGAGLCCGLGALVVFDRFLLTRDGLAFHLEEVIIAAVMVASLVVAWARTGWSLPAAFGGGWAALLLAAKPFLWPLVSGEGSTYPPLSATNHYFLFSAAGLLVAALIPALRWLRALGR